MISDKNVNQFDLIPSIEIEGDTVTLVGIQVNAPKTAATLKAFPEAEWPAVVERLLEYGSDVQSTMQASAQQKLLEAKMADALDKLDSEVGEKLGSRLKQDRDSAKETLQRLLDDNHHRSVALLKKFADPDSKESVVARANESFEVTTRHLLRQVDRMLEGDEDAPLAKLRKDLINEVRESQQRILKELATREVLAAGPIGGLEFEDSLAKRLVSLARVMGATVEPCSTAQGAHARKTGDYLIRLPLNQHGDSVRVVVEAKNQSSTFSVERIRKELEEARRNRGAVAAVFVGSSAKMLPHKISFGEINDTDFYAAFDPETGDETALISALQLARYAALATISEPATTGVDTEAAKKEVAGMRAMVDGIARVESSFAKVHKEASGGEEATRAFRDRLIDHIRRLDDILAA